jgi:mannosyltransferase
MITSFRSLLRRPGPALATIVLVALAVRLYDLGGESIWRDEAYSIAIAARPPLDIVSQMAHKDTTPPLYYLALHSWQEVFGDSSHAARMPSVVAGTLAVLFAYFVAAPLMGPSGGLMAALIHALSPFLVAYSQETRQYSLFSCVSLASFAFLIALLNDRRLAIPAYIVASTVMCYTHSVGIIVLLAQMMFVGSSALLFGTLRWRTALISQALAATAFLPWTIVLLQQYRRPAVMSWVPPPTLASLAGTLYSFVQSALLVQLCLILGALGLLQITSVPSSTPSRNVLGVLANRAWFVRIADVQWSWLLVCWLVVPIAALFVISHVGTPIYVDRATIAAASAFYLLVARGLTQLRGGLRVVVLATACVLLCAELVEYYKGVGKEQWREMVADVSVLVRPNDIFVFHQRGRGSAFDYYFKDRGVRRVGFPDRVYDYDDVVTKHDIESLPSVVGDHTRVWLVLVTSRDRDGLIRDYLRRTRREFFHRRYKGIEVYAFERS